MLNLYFWIKKEAPESILYVLIGNKNDINNKREVSYKEGKYYDKKNNMMFYETPAKNKINIEIYLEKVMNILIIEFKKDFII